VLAFVPALDKLMRNFNVIFLVFMAIFTGARLADAGYRRWVGVMAVVTILVIVPLIAFLIALAAFHMHPAVVLGPVAVGTLVLFLPFVIWAATRPGLRDPHERLEEARMNGRFAPTASNGRLDRVLNRTPRTFGQS
jgi:amino acid transporter